MASLWTTATLDSANFEKCKIIEKIGLLSGCQLFDVFQNSYTVLSTVLQNDKQGQYNIVPGVDPVSTINWLDNFCAGFYRRQITSRPHKEDYCSITAVSRAGRSWAEHRA